MIARLAAAAALIALGGCATTMQTTGHPPVSAPPSGMQFLYGSGEAAALSVQAYAAMVDQVRAGLGRASSVVLGADGSLDAPRFTDCAGKRPAVVFDMDETLVLNLGYEYDEARSGRSYDQARWDRWEASGVNAVAPVPGAVSALTELRRLGVTPIVNSNRNASTADASIAALRNAGLGGFAHGETLFLKGDVAPGGGKDPRRAAIAARWCVVAMMGDQLGDFSDRFAGAPAARRAQVRASPMITALWGHGWFILPNSAYGAGLAGGWDDVFPTDKRWADPAGNGGK